MAENFIGITDKGKRREKNEDNFIAQKLPNDFIVACAIDGVGGYKGGEVAAEIARTVILEHLKNLSGNVTEALQKAIDTANIKIQQEKKKNSNHTQMACVLTCAVTHIKTNKLYYAHVGDTRLYLLRDHSLVKISKDHSVVGYLEDSGRLSEEDAMRHPKRNEINKALGFEEKIEGIAGYIETGESPFLPGDTILLCSDGLSDMIDSSAMTSILNKKGSLAVKVQQLVDAANEAGGNDNITAVLVQNNKQQKQQEAYKPVDRKEDSKKSPLYAIKTAAQQKPAPSQKINKSTMVLVAIISLVLLVVLSGSLFKNKSGLAEKNNVSEIKKPNELDLKLMQLIAYAKDTNKVYALAKDGSILISEPIVINKDSFMIRGNGSHIIRDTNYKGPAFIISNTAEHIVLDSLVFENFDAALLVQKNNIEFRNVRFINCRAAVQYMVSLPDTTISGRLTNSIFNTTKSLSKK